VLSFVLVHDEVRNKKSLRERITFLTMERIFQPLGGKALPWHGSNCTKHSGTFQQAPE
jgi:hypothetical protein